jgi:virulence factor Mce-like protein
MTRRRGTASLVASPVLVGAVTVLIAIIAVFIAYNANQGLPFVPTYDVKAELPSGNKLVKGNEVHVGGFRVGVVDDIQPRLKDGKAIAEISMKLDKTVEPLAKDTTLRVRPRSALGLKYVEVTPGHSRQTWAAGDTIPLKQASEPLELEDVFSTFDGKTRRNSQGATQGFGDAFAGRGTSINEAIAALNPLFKSLTPVMRNLSDPDTRLDNFFRQLGRASAQAAPVARTQAVLFTNMADTFAAISSDPVALQQTIEKSPSTIDVSVRSFRVQRPFLADFADLSRRLRPAAQELPRSLPRINEALRVGTPVLPRTVALNNRLEGLFSQLDDLFENPATLMTLRKLRTTLAVTRPAMEFIAPYQSVCNYANYFLGRLGEHQSQANGQGTTQNQGVKLVNNTQPNTIGNTESSRPWDVPPGNDPRGSKDDLGQPLGRLYSIPYQPAIDAQGNADCQNGQDGYIRGPLAPGARYGPGKLADGAPTGGNFPVTQSNFPILSGGTFATDRLGIKNLRDVP